MRGSTVTAASARRARNLLLAADGVARTRIATTHLPTPEQPGTGARPSSPHRAGSGAVRTDARGCSGRRFASIGSRSTSTPGLSGPSGRRPPLPRGRAAATARRTSAAAVPSSPNRRRAEPRASRRMSRAGSRTARGTRCTAAHHRRRQRQPRVVDPHVDAAVAVVAVRHPVTGRAHAASIDLAAMHRGAAAAPRRPLNPACAGRFSDRAPGRRRARGLATARPPRPRSRGPATRASRPRPSTARPGTNR